MGKKPKSQKWTREHARNAPECKLPTKSMEMYMKATIPWAENNIRLVSRRGHIPYPRYSSPPLPYNQSQRSPLPQQPLQNSIRTAWLPVTKLQDPGPPKDRQILRTAQGSSPLPHTVHPYRMRTATSSPSTRPSPSHAPLRLRARIKTSDTKSSQLCCIPTLLPIRPRTKLHLLLHLHLHALQSTSLITTRNPSEHEQSARPSAREYAQPGHPSDEHLHTTASLKAPSALKHSLTESFDVRCSMPCTRERERERIQRHARRRSRGRDGME